jgi:anti-sigma B factor antagonist
MPTPADRFSIDGDHVVVATGEIDVCSAPKLWETVSLLIERGHLDVVLDLAGVEFMDSQGIAVIVRALKHVQPMGGTVTVRSPRAQVSTVLEISGLTELIRVEG